MTGTPNVHTKYGVTTRGGVPKVALGASKIKIAPGAILLLAIRARSHDPVCVRESQSLWKLNLYLRHSHNLNIVLGNPFKMACKHVDAAGEFFIISRSIIWKSPRVKLRASTSHSPLQTYRYKTLNGYSKPFNFLFGFTIANTRTRVVPSGSKSGCVSRRLHSML